MLARSALASGDLDGAQAHAVRMPATPARNELLAQIADGRGQSQLALEYYLVAPDVAAVGRYVTAMGVKDPAGSVRARERSARALGSVDDPSRRGRGGVLDARAAGDPARLSGPAGARAAAWKASLANYRQAVALAPLSEKYWLGLGNQYVLLEDWPSSREAFERARDINPNSIDATAGLALAASHGAGP